jgi:hypothetical protein
MAPFVAPIFPFLPDMPGQGVHPGSERSALIHFGKIKGKHQPDEPLKSCKNHRLHKVK